MKKNDLDDLVDRLKKDDREAFNLLFYMYAEKLSKFSLTFFNDQDDAKEVVQEVFLKIWINRKKIQNPSTFNSYIYTIAKNLIFNNLKKNIRRKKYEYFAFNNLEKQKNATENEVFYREKKQVINKVLSQLPAKRREVFILSRFEGLKNREIAERLDISIKTVETHMTLALKRFHEVFTFYGKSAISLIIISGLTIA